MREQSNHGVRDSDKFYQYILLDWDGNIAKTLDLWLDTFREVLDAEGYVSSDKEIAASFGRVDEYFAGLGIESHAELYERANQLGKLRLPQVELYPDAVEVLLYLKNTGKNTALITASARENINGLLKRYELYRFFDVIITRDDVTKHKPDPEPLLQAFEQLQAVPAQSIMIGDSDKDIGAATNAGIDSILFYPPEHQKFYDIERLMDLKPTYVVDDFRQITRIIQ